MNPELLNMLSGILGNSDAPAAPDPLPSFSMPNTAEQPIGLTQGMPMPAPTQPAHSSGKRNALDLVRDLAPMIMSAVAGIGHPERGAALANGYASGATQAHLEQSKEEDRADERSQQALHFQQQTAQAVMSLKDPVMRQRYLQYAHDIGVEHFGLPDNWTQKVPAGDAKDDVLSSLKGELSTKLAAFDKDKKWSSVAGTPGESKISFQLSNGQSVPVSMARRLVGQAVFDSSGQQAFAPEGSTEAPENKTDYSRFLTRYAQKLGKKSANELSADEELAAKKAYGQADDRPLKGPDPLTQAINELRLATLKKNSAADVTPGQATAAGKLADDFRSESKDFIQVSQAYNRVRASAKDPSAAGDLALIFNYMKTLDPGSTVREGEFATAQNAAGIPDRIRAAYNKATSGERLAPDQRADFVDRAKRLYTQALGQQQRIATQYKKRAASIGVPDDLVVTDYSVEDGEQAPAQNAKTAPAAAPKKIGRFNVVVGGSH